jgi:hypothetical protein
MEAELYKPIFECTLKEMEERLRPVIERVEAENLKAGFYNIYQYGNSKDMFVHQYANHRDLVRVNAATGEITMVNANF